MALWRGGIVVVVVVGIFDAFEVGPWEGSECLDALLTLIMVTWFFLARVLLAGGEGVDEVLEWVVVLAEADVAAS